MSHDHRSEEHWLMHLIDQLSLRRWLSLWVGTVFISALFYWFASLYMEGHGVRCTIHNGMKESSISFATALYFSCVSTTTLGYGDFAPEGISRVFTIFQACLGMIVIGVIISKILARHQEQMISDTNRIALTERSASVLTALNAQLIEFQEISISHERNDRSADSDERILRRWENAELRFSFLLDSIHQLLRVRGILAGTKSKILKALRNTVDEFVIACEKCDSTSDVASKSALLGICDCPEVAKGLPDDQSVAEILRCLNSNTAN